MELQSFAMTLLKPLPALPEKGLFDRIIKKPTTKTGK